MRNISTELESLHENVYCFILSLREASENKMKPLQFIFLFVLAVFSEQFLFYFIFC